VHMKGERASAGAGQEQRNRQERFSSASDGPQTAVTAAKMTLMRHHL
jgi:hypothetical protein